jgi:hypothetical protein
MVRCRACQLKRKAKLLVKANAARAKERAATRKTKVDHGKGA